MSPSSLLRLTNSSTRLLRQPCRIALINFTSQRRRLSQTNFLRYPRKDSQDRESINTEATENTKSGTDDSAARQEEAAFDPNKTDPESEKGAAGVGNEQSGNPLEVSGANPDVSKERNQTEGGAEHGTGQRKSGGGSPKKAGKV